MRDGKEAQPSGGKYYDLRWDYMHKYSVIPDDQCHLKKSDWGVLDQL